MTNPPSRKLRTLKRYKVPAIVSQRVELLIGQNAQRAFCISELRYGNDDAPYGIHTALG